MSAGINEQNINNGSSLINEELYRVFVIQSSEAVWRFELDEPVSVHLSPDEQIEQFYRCGFLAECNPAMARMYGYDSPEEIIGARLGDFLVRDDKANVEYLRAFIESGYRLEDAESHEVDRSGNPKFFLNNLVGMVENGLLKRAWGTQRDVTGRKEIERSKAHLAAIVESSDDAIVSKDLNGIIMSWNKGAEKVFGYTADEVVGKSITILIPEHLLSEEKKIITHIKSGKAVKHYETIRQRKDGTLINISLTVSPIRNDAGEIIGASKIARDITENKRTQEALRESEERYRGIINQTVGGVAETDLSGRFVTVNARFCEITGYSREELLADMRMQDITHEDDLAKNLELFGRCVTEGAPFDIEKRYVRKDGSYVWVHNSVSAVRGADGKPRSLVAVVVDITEKRRAEETLRDSEEKFAKAFNSSPLVLTITSLKTGKLIDVNDTFVRTTGYTRAEAVGKTTDELGLWANPEDRKEELEAVRIKGEIRDLEYHFRLKNGTKVIGLLSAELLELRGEPCALTVIQDITERKKAEEISDRYRLLSQRARDVIFFFRPDGRIVDANRVAVETYGYAQEELLKMTLRDLRAPETLNLLREQLDKANHGGIQFETIHIRKDGSRFPVEVTSVGADIGGERLLISIIRDITERRKSEETVRQSMKQLSLVTDIAPVYIAHCSRDLRFKFVNKTYSERFGLKPEDCIGKPIVEILGQEALDKISGFIEKVLSGQPVDFEIELPYPRIGTRFMHCSYVPEFGENEEVVGFVVAVTDISERRKMEEAVRESEKRFRTMTNNAPMLVWMSGTDMLCTYFNQTWLDFTGRTMDEELGDKWTKSIHPDDYDLFIEVSTKAFNAREDFEMEYRLRRFDGEYRWILDKGVPLFTHNGTFIGYIGSAIDVTDRKLGQEALLRAERRASEEYLELLSRIVPLAQTLGTARDLNSIYRALHEFVRVSMPCSAFFVSFYDSARSLRTAAYVWGEQGEVDVSELPPMPLTADGGPNSQAVFEKRSVIVNNYWDFMQKRPHLVLQNNGRDPLSSLVVPMTVMNRITGTLEVQTYQDEAFTKEHIIALEMAANLAAVAIENVRLLQVEAEARSAAEAANRAKDEFLSVLSHELRTPLNSMLGWTRMLRGGMLDAEKTEKAIEVIERNTILQNNLIEDLLDVSRIISGKMRIEKEMVDLVKVFNEAIEILRPVAAQKRIEFETLAGEKSLIINGDATRIHQIIVNLVQNAVKFTDEGGRVSVVLLQKGNCARFVVKDNGIGISSELLPHIFERFRQADSSTKRTFSGLGLGLTIVHNLVELHGGTIKAESEGAGRGATFTVEIPLMKEFLERSSADSKAKFSTNGSAALAGARILLVDDDAESLMPLQLFLEKEKAEIVTATSVKDALNKLSGQKFHILITDIGMPLADGYDLIAKVRQLQTEQNAFITAIALTAYASADDRRRALASGFQDHFAKPVNYDELLTTVKRIYENLSGK